MTDPRADDTALKDAIRDRIEALGDPGAVIIGYALVAEVMTPDIQGPWLKTLQDPDSTPWAQAGRVQGLANVIDTRLQDGWEPDGGDE